MLNTKTIQQLAKKEMNRKQFLQFVGTAVLSIIGLTAFLNNLNKFASQPRPAPPKSKDNSYGGSAYGV